MPRQACASTQSDHRHRKECYLILLHSKTHSLADQTGLSTSWSKTLKTGYLASRSSHIKE